MKGLVSLVSGLLFGFGLVLGGMTDPARVIGFLDLAGRWDPSLAFVMGGALCVTLPAFQLFKRRSKPLLAPVFHEPTTTALDRPLLAGAAVFGIGWGIAGLCPGPAIANLSGGTPEILAFVASMMAGIWLRQRVATYRQPPASGVAPARGG